MEKQYEKDLFAAFAERTVKRLWILLIILVVMLFGSWTYFWFYERQWEVEETTIEADQRTWSGDNYAVGGDFTNGYTESDDQNP